MLKALERYLDSCGEGEIYEGLQELDPRRHRMLLEEEIEWHKTHRPNSTFYNPSWKMRPGQTKVYQSEHLRRIFVEIVGQQLVPALEKNEWKEGTDTGKRMGTAPMSINDLLRQLERHVGAHPYFFGGFVRDMIVAVMANDIDLSLANTYDELQDIMQWVDAKNWLHSIDSKRTITLEEAVKEGWKKAKHPAYLNYVSVQKCLLRMSAFVSSALTHTSSSVPLRLCAQTNNSRNTNRATRAATMQSSRRCLAYTPTLTARASDTRFRRTPAGSTRTSRATSSPTTRAMRC